MGLLRRLLNKAPAPGAARQEDDAPSAAAAAAAGGAQLNRGALLEAIALAQEQGKFGEALALVDPALALTPEDPELLFARGALLFAWRRTHDARRDLVHAEARGLRNLRVFLHLGWAELRLGRPREAEPWLRKAIAADPGSAEALAGLALVRRQLGNHDEAVALYRRALALDDGDVPSRVGLGTTLLGDEPAAAEAEFRRMLAQGSDPAGAWGFLGMALALQDRNGEAMDAFVRADELERAGGGGGDAFSNLAIHLGDEGRTAEALATFERGLAAHDGVAAHLAYAHALMRSGQLREGWERYEFRWMVAPGVSRRRNFGGPAWSGQDLRGKTILLVAEQGLGDAFQFIRYAPLLKQLGATVAMLPSKPLWGIAQRFPGVDLLVQSEDRLPPFDYHVPLMSLPRVFGTDLQTIPAGIPYLFADPGLASKWRATLGADDRLRVGLVWAGSPGHQRDRYRSLPLATLGPLGAIPGVRLVSLQRGVAADEVARVPAPFEIENLGPGLEDWSDAAALVDGLDLLVGVDTAVLHLGAAMGKPAWMLLPQPPDFRWLEGREDSSWYPTMRLFRQAKRGDWAEVVGRVAAALRERASASPLPAPVVAASTAQRSDPVPAMVPPDPQHIPGHRPGFAAVVETRVGILEYLPDQALVGPSLRWYGEYAHAQLELVAGLLRPGAVVVEAGPGVGAHAIAIAGMVGEAGHLYLYESRPMLHALLRQNLSANRVANATLLRRVLGSRGDPEPVAAARSDGAPGDAAVGRDTLDDLRLARLDLLKIGEPDLVADVLDGAADTLWQLRPAVFVAAGGADDAAPIAARLAGFGYRCWRFEAPLFDPQNFNRREDDIFGGRTALALLALPEEAEVRTPLYGCTEIP